MDEADDLLRALLLESFADALAGTPSDWPKCASAPNSAERSSPELMVITGMPASRAASIEPCRASGFAIDTTIPSGWLATAESISCACRDPSGSPVTSTSTPYWAPPSSAPFFTTFQNEPSGTPWMITA